ncbi:hypothetical protein EVAR_44993_1 [Eumeta japonica]|uniref:Uncharacterized protein n=1 Tax=Eumeta variegata TaxID=151549 RepID=A0A4C1XI76_EUMVA|nr:hypothetical protein EVAR_44993_1 [Eumeta japonica]
MVKYLGYCWKQVMKRLWSPIAKFKIPCCRMMFKVTARTARFPQYHNRQILKMILELCLLKAFRPMYQIMLLYHSIKVFEVKMVIAGRQQREECVAGYPLVISYGHRKALLG